MLRWLQQLNACSKQCRCTPTEVVCLPADPPGPLLRLRPLSNEDSLFADSPEGVAGSWPRRLSEIGAAQEDGANSMVAAMRAARARVAQMVAAPALAEVGGMGGAVAVVHKLWVQLKLTA